MGRDDDTGGGHSEYRLRWKTGPQASSPTAAATGVKVRSRRLEARARASVDSTSIYIHSGASVAGISSRIVPTTDRRPPDDAKRNDGGSSVTRVSYFYPHFLSYNKSGVGYPGGTIVSVFRIVVVMAVVVAFVV